MRFLGHVWAVVVNLVALLVVFAAISAATTTYETVVVVGLVLLYLNTGFNTTSIVRTQMELFQAQAGLQVQILKAMHDPGVPREERGLRELTEEYRRTNTRFYINLVFGGLTWLIAVAVLVLSLLS